MYAAILTDSRREGQHLSLLLAQFQREFYVPMQVEIFDRAALDQGLGAYDIVLLDGELPDCMEIGVHLRKQQAACRIILFTGDNRMAKLGYAIHPDGFLPKPVDYPALRTALERCRSSWQEAARAVELTVNRVQVHILCGDIEYFEMQGRQLTLHGRYGQLESRTPMVQMEKQLEGMPFLSPQRSYLVNLFHVKALEQEHLIMESGERVPVSADRREQTASLWRKFQEENSFWSEGRSVGPGNS